MDAIQRRTIVGMSGLVALWVVVYWAWQPRADRGPAVTFPDRALLEGTGTDPAAPDGAASEQPPPAPEQEDPAPGPAQPVPEEPFGRPPFRWLVARDGDTFQKIAQREFGSPSLWTAIARANPLKDPARLRPGDRIKIPLDPANPQGGPAAEEPETLPPPPRIVEYTVEPGDTLSGIAARFYGTARLSGYLYDANRDRLTGPDDLRVGQVIVVPPAPEGGAGG